jgi:hypothetical protein
MNLSSRPTSILRDIVVVMEETPEAAGWLQAVEEKTAFAAVPFKDPGC